MTLIEAADAYQEKFGVVPTIVGLPGEKQKEAAQLLADAVEDDRPFEDDKEFFETLGIELPPGDADI